MKITKKIFALTFISFFCISSLVLALHTKTEKNVILPDNISREINGFTVSVNSAVELLSAVLLLSGDAVKEVNPVTDTYSVGYINDMRDYFKDFQNHEAVLWVNANIENGFSFARPITALMLLNDDFTVNEENFNMLDPTTGFSFSLSEFSKVMKSFYIDTDFENFFKEHESDYIEMLSNSEQFFPRWDMLQAMEQFYGKRLAGYNIVLFPVIYRNYGPLIPKNGQQHAYAFIGCHRYDGRFILDYNIILHEFGHSFIPINDMKTDETLYKAVAGTEYLMEPIQSRMDNIAYGSWEVTLEEHVLRATTIKIRVMNGDLPVPKSVLEYEKSWGFIYIDKIYQILDEYILSEEEYNNFDEFIPKLLNDLEAASIEAK